MADIPHAVPRILGYLGRSHIWDTEIPAVHLALCSHSMFNAYVDLIHGRTDFFVERSYYELAQQHEMPVLGIMLYLGRRHICDNNISAGSLALCSRSLFKRYCALINDRTVSRPLRLLRRAASPITTLKYSSGFPPHLGSFGLVNGSLSSGVSVSTPARSIHARKNLLRAIGAG